MAHAKRHARPGRLTRRFVVTACSVCVLGANTGCQSALERWDVDALITTIPVGGQARAVVPSVIGPAAIAAAGVKALQRRGYIVVRHHVTAGRIELLARAPVVPSRELLSRRVTIEARETSAGTTIEVSIAPLSDADEARAVLRHTLNLLKPASLAAGG